MFWNRGEKGISLTDKILEKALGDTSHEPVKKIQVNKPRKEEVVSEESRFDHDVLQEELESSETDSSEEVVHVSVVAEDAPVIEMETVLDEIEESSAPQSPDPILETAEEEKEVEEEPFDLLPPLKPKHIPVHGIDIPSVIPMTTENGEAHISTSEDVQNSVLEDAASIPTIEAQEIETVPHHEKSVAHVHQEVKTEVAEAKRMPHAESVQEEVELSPLERMPVHKDQYFRLQSGESLKSIKDLIQSLETMNQHTWNHHVHNGRNDFANWVEHVFHDKSLAHAMKDYHNAHTLRVFLRNAF